MSLATVGLIVIAVPFAIIAAQLIYYMICLMRHGDQGAWSLFFILVGALLVFIGTQP